MKTPKSILLVEDDKSDQFFFIAALNEIEDTVLYKVANNGKEALDILDTATKLPDMIFTDINMPVMDGLEYLSKICQRQHFKNIPVVVLSSDTSKAEIVRSLGAKSFIDKPSNLKLLKKELEQAIDFICRAEGQSAE
jgi:CheY-like chemotaxis protein